MALEKKSSQTLIKKYFSLEISWIFLVLLGIIAILALISPNFLTITNIRNVMKQSSINALLAAGMTIVIISGGIDLSVGSVLAFSAASVAVSIRAGIPEVPSIIIGLLAGTVLGVFNGVVIAKGRIPAFIATLGMMTIARGLALIITQAESFPVTSPFFMTIGAERFLGIPYAMIIVIVFYALLHYILNNSKFGRYVYCIGGNEEAARLSGINVDKYKILFYAISGFFAAVAGLVMIGRLASAPPTVANKAELDAIAAVIIGGTSFSGGMGSVVGTIIGAFIMGFLRNGFNLLDVSTFWQMVFIGLVIIVSVWIDNLRHKR